MVKFQEEIAAGRQLTLDGCIIKDSSCALLNLAQELKNGYGFNTCVVTSKFFPVLTKSPSKRGRKSNVVKLQEKEVSVVDPTLNELVIASDQVVVDST